MTITSVAYADRQKAGVVIRGVENGIGFCCVCPVSARRPIWRKVQSWLLADPGNAIGPFVPPGPETKAERTSGLFVTREEFVALLEGIDDGSLMPGQGVGLPAMQRTIRGKMKD